MKDRNNNLEQQLADKLGNRSIAPGGQAWDRIAQNREQGKDKKRKKRTYVYYVASIVLLLLFGSYFFMTVNNAVTIEAQPQVVNSGNTEKKIKSGDVVEDVEFALPLQHTERVAAYKITKQNVDADVVNTTREEVPMIADSYKAPETRENLPEAGVASLQPAKVFSKDERYDAEVDYLLKNAVKDIAVDKHLNTRTNDAALLKEVEGEMNEYYREKAMSIFSLKNKKIRFAVKN